MCKKKLRVIIDPGCIGCGACEFIVPEVFAVDNISRVKNDVDLEKYETKIKEAIEKCPCRVLKLTDECNEQD